MKWKPPLTKKWVLTMEPKFTPAFIDEVRSRTNLADLACKATKLDKQKDEYVGLCPFHTETTPSFTVVPDKGFYHCFGCGAHGSAFDFVMETEGLNFVQTVAALALDAGLDIPGEVEPVQRKKLKPVVCHEKSVEENAKSRDEKRKKAYKRWCQGVSLEGSIAEIYLHEARGIPLETIRSVQSLKCAPNVGYWVKEGNDFECIWEGPALLAAMQWPDGKFAALHTTYLLHDGSGKLALFQPSGKKYPAKKMSGTPTGAAIRLSEPGPHMYLGEGIETTLSVMAAMEKPGWCAYSLDNLCGSGMGKGKVDPRDERRKLPSEIPDMSRPGMLLPPVCEKATYLGDGDTKDMHMLHAKLKRASRRMMQMGLEADYVVSPPGMDFNDLIRGRG